MLTARYGTQSWKKILNAFTNCLNISKTCLISWEVMPDSVPACWLSINLALSCWPSETAASRGCTESYLLNMILVINAMKHIYGIMLLHHGNSIKTALLVLYWFSFTGPETRLWLGAFERHNKSKELIFVAFFSPLLDLQASVGHESQDGKHAYIKTK